VEPAVGNKKPRCGQRGFHSAATNPTSDSARTPCSLQPCGACLPSS
jgi:hypothetical protein